MTQYYGDKTVMAKLKTNFTTYLHSSRTSGVGFAVHSGQILQETEHCVSETSLLSDFERYHLNYYKIIFISKLLLKLCSFLRQFLRLMRLFCNCGSYSQDELWKAVESLKLPYISQITN